MVVGRRRTRADAPSVAGSPPSVRPPWRRCRRTDSDLRALAKAFGKRHGNVLQAYDNLKCSADFGRHNFVPTEYLDEQGKTCRSITMTKDGFTMLAMCFTGRAHWPSRSPTSPLSTPWPNVSPASIRTCGRFIRRWWPKWSVLRYVMTGVGGFVERLEDFDDNAWVNGLRPIDFSKEDVLFRLRPPMTSTRTSSL